MPALVIPTRAALLESTVRLQTATATAVQTATSLVTVVWMLTAHHVIIGLHMSILNCYHLILIQNPEHVLMLASQDAVTT